LVTSRASRYRTASDSDRMLHSMCESWSFGFS
jgi:hypothetical protein